MKNNIVVNSLLLSSAIVAIGTTDAYAAQTGTVTASALNIRSGAGTNYSVITKVYKGESVDILDTSNGWYKVKLSNGKIGWASSDYITRMSNSNSNSQNGSSISGYGKVTASTLNVRSGAGTSYSVVTKVYKGNKVELLESSNGWYKIKLSSGKVGWASSDYITRINNSSNNNSQSGTSISGYGKVTASTLNVRSGAGTSYSVVTKAYKGDKVELLESSNGWYKIKLSSGKVGWVSSDYITKIDNSNNTEHETPSIDKAQAIVNLATKQLGKPYVWGAEGPNSFDCSGLIYYVYKNAVGMSLPRTSIEQSRTGTTVSMSNLKPGDLIFSSTDGSGSVNHVGIYVGNNEMIHAPKVGDVVKKSKMNTSYWIDSYVVSKRVL